MPLPPLTAVTDIHERLRLEPGPSSVISRAVAKDLAPRFSEQRGVIWLSESRNQVVARDDGLAQKIGLTIQPDRNLPGLILVDCVGNRVDHPRE